MISCIPSAVWPWARCPLPLPQVSGRQPDDIVGIGQIVDDNTLRLYENARENDSSEKLFAFDFKTFSREILIRRSPEAMFFLEIFSVYEKIAVYEIFNI